MISIMRQGFLGMMENTFESMLHFAYFSVMAYYVNNIDDSMILKLPTLTGRHRDTLMVGIEDKMF